MAATVIKPTIFSAEVIKNRDIKNVFYRYTNSDYTGELRMAGDTVTVQTLPTLSFASGTAGAAISDSAFTITSENLVINQVRQLRVRITEEDKVQSNLQLTRKIAERFAEAEARLFDEVVRDQILVTQVADIPAANKIDSGAPATITKTNVFEKIEGLKVALAQQNVTDDLVLFVSPAIASLLRQSGILDANDLGLVVRKKGYMGMISGVMVVETNALTASKEMIMMADKAINMVVQLNNMDVRKGTDGFYENVLAEIIFGLKIFGENAKAIAIQYVS